MIRYYFKLALRNIRRNKGFAFLNIAGFALGLSSFLLISSFVIDELAYDRYHLKYDKIYRLDTDLKYGGSLTSFAITAPPVAEALLHDFPTVKHAVRITPAQNIQIKKGTEIIQEDRVLYADESIFDVFSFDVLDGATQGALRDPGSIVIMKSTALKYFGEVNVSGKTLTIANDTSLHTITAVLEDMPTRSHFHADVLLPLHTQENSRHTNFNQFSFNTYIVVDDPRQAEHLTAKLPDFMKMRLSENMNVDAFEQGGNFIRLTLTPLADIHLHSNKQRELEVNSDITYVYIFATIALLILGLACINFVNLFTARSANRAKEVGVRKTFGSIRTSIMLQFLTEAFVMTVISTAMALIISIGCLPMFNILSGKNFVMTIDTLLLILPVIIVITVSLALIAGFYPAFYLSSFKPAKVLKGDLSSGFKNANLRSTLVVIQFSIATFLITGSLVILDQLKFIQSKNVGFNRDHVLVISNVSALPDPKIFKDQVKQLSGVVSVSLSGYLPTGNVRWPNSISSESHQGLLAEFWPIDSDYIKTLEMQIVSGRNFSEELATDSSGIIINNTAARILFPHTPAVGSKLEAAGRTFEVIGVVNDFHFNSLQHEVTPLVMTLDSDWRVNLIVRVAAGQLPNALQNINASWRQLNPQQHFEFSVMEEDFNAFYDKEQRMQKLFSVFTALAIIIAGLGLFGLSAYAADQRTRELSVRKVLGATTTHIFRLLTFDFIKLLVIAIAIALPLAWWILERWLNDFAYRIDISLSTFVISTLAILGVGIFTISHQTLKAAVSNPVESLRNE